MSNAGARARGVDTTAPTTFHRHAAIPEVELWQASYSAESRLSLVLPAFAFAGSSGEGPRSMRYQYRGQIGRAFSDDISTFEPDEPLSQLDLSGPMLVRSLLVSPEYVREVVDGDFTTREPIHLRSAFDTSGALQPRLQRVQALLTDVGADPLELEAAVRSLVRVAFQRHGERAPRRTDRVCSLAIRRAIDLMQSTYAEALTLERIAKHVGVSRWHFERSFSDAMGVPVHRYLRGIRVARALNLLAKGHLATDVAAAVGFSDQPHLTNTFRHHLGFTPAAYRLKK